MESTERKILRWYHAGNTGTSSECMAAVAVGDKPKYTWTPSDPSDLNRCIQLTLAAPDVRDSFQSLSKVSNQWETLVKNWDRLVDMFHDEVGVNWSKGNSAPATYNEMKRLGF